LHCAFDEATALLAGNALQSLAFDTLTHEDTHPDARIRIRLVEGLARALGPKGNAGGQMLDLIGRNENLDVGAITRMQKMKTGGVIMFACEAGALMGKASPKHVVAVRNYAHDFGMTFQMMADLSDVTKPRQDMGQDPKAKRSSFLAHMKPGEAVAKGQILVNQCIHHLNVFEPARVEILVDLAKSLLDGHA
jgi:farnesyl diphosphate synthase